MMRRVLFLITAVLCVTGAMAAVPADSLRVQVSVEITMPDGTCVTRNVTTNIADPGPDASVGTLINLAAQKLAPAYRPVEVREVRIVETQIVEVPVPSASQVVVDTVMPAVAEDVSVGVPEHEVDSVTGQEIVPLVPAETVAKSESGAVRKHKNYDRHAWDPRLAESVSNVRFAWGADFGTSIDLSAHDMTSVDLNMSLGLTYRWLIFAGLGAGAQMMVSNSCRTYPVYLNFRTDFSRKVLPIFLDLRAGVAFNCLPENINQQAPYASIALGFNLATGRTFRSYILCGYTYNHRGDMDSEIGLMKFPALSMAAVRLGVQF